MTRHLPIALASCAAFTFAAVPANAQTSGGDVNAPFTLEERRGFYEKTRRDHVPYVLSNAALPGLGNLLNDQPLLGGGFVGVFAISALMLGFGLSNDDPQIAVVGGVFLASTYAGSMITTSFGVDAYNARLRRRYKIDDDQAARGSLPGLTVSFAF